MESRARTIEHDRKKNASKQDKIYDLTENKQKVAYMNNQFSGQKAKSVKKTANSPLNDVVTYL
jgi:hypothetical protein